MPAEVHADARTHRAGLDGQPVAEALGDPQPAPARRRSSARRTSGTEAGAVRVFDREDERVGRLVDVQDPVAAAVQDTVDRHLVDGEHDVVGPVWDALAGERPHELAHAAEVLRAELEPAELAPRPPVAPPQLIVPLLRDPWDARPRAVRMAP